MAILPFQPSYTLIKSQGLYDFCTLGFYQSTVSALGNAPSLVHPTWILFGLNVCIILLSLISIFLFKRRVLQMRITVFNILLKIGMFALAALEIYLFGQEGNQSLGGMVKVWIAAPIIALIFDYLAHRAIAIDERLIQYLNSGRLR